LHILREAGVSPLDIDLVGLPALWLEEKGMGTLVGKANDLVLYRGAIAGTDPVDEAGKQRGPVKV
jgi:hypothetical protein